MPNVKISELPSITTVADANMLPVVESTTTKKATAKQVRLFTRANQRWMPIDTTKYTANPPAIDTITCSDTTDFAIGLPLKYAYGGSTYYGMVVAINAGVSITVAGAPLVPGTPLTALYVGTPEMVFSDRFYIPGLYGAVAQDIFTGIALQSAKWAGREARCVRIQAVHRVIDSGANQPKINFKIGVVLVSTNDANSGIQLGAAWTWVNNPNVAVSTANYVATYDANLNVRCTVAGSNGDASDLTVVVTFVLTE